MTYGISAMPLIFARFAQAALWFAALLLFYLGAFVTNQWSPDAAVRVATQRYDNARTGGNFSETVLNPSNVEAPRFGKLFTRAVDDDVHAQPLYVPDVTLPDLLPGGIALSEGLQRLVKATLVALHLKRVINVLYVATANNSVYAFDADDPSAAAPIWHVNLTNEGSGARPVKNFDVGQRCGNYPDFAENIGIVGTPVIDANNHTLYVVARTYENGQFVQRLHALDILTGAEQADSPVVIEARVKGTGAGSSNGLLTFDPQIHNQRGALLLVNGIIYITWGSHCDTGPYHGWIMGYDATTLTQVFAKATTPDGEGGGIWQSNTGPSADASGNIYIAIGNGTVTAPTGAKDYGNAVLKLGRTGEVLSWFIPYNFEELNKNDFDFGTTGVLLVPTTNVLATGSKEGKLYVLDRDNLGGFQPESDSQIIASLKTGPGWLLGTPTYWNSSGVPHLYVWCSGSPGQSFRLFRSPLALSKESGVLKSAAESDEPALSSRDAVLTEVSRTKIIAQDIPGGVLSISADGNKAGSGILWASLGEGSTFLRATVPGVLRAFDATDLSHELWNSQQNPRDDFGNLAKFNTPVVANGRVYLATFSRQIAVYGLHNPNNAPPTVIARSNLPVANTATLFGQVKDDGLPKSPGAITTSWIQVTGPAPSIIESPHSLETKVIFPAPGDYVFRLAASDGELSSDADISVSIPDLVSGLIGLWTFQEGRGNDVRDSSGNLNHGRLFPRNAAVETRGTGEFSGSVLTYGNPIRIPASDSLNQLTKQITVSARIYPRQLPTNEFVAVVQRQWREEIHPDLFFLGYGPRDGVLHYKWHLGLVGTEVDLFGLPVGEKEPAVGEWVHLAGTYDSSTGTASLYVNGELIGTETSSGEIRIDQESLERPLMIGAEINGSDTQEVANGFNGYVDEVRIYDRALSVEAIRGLASSAQPPQVHSAALIHTDDLPIQGGPGGDHFRDDCSDNYAVGLYARSGAWIDAIGLQCSRFEPRLEMFDMPPSDKSYHGGAGGAFGAEGTCPRDAYLSGITQSFTVSENEYRFLNSLEMTCTRMTDGSAVNICLETGHGCSGERSPDASAQETQLSKPIEQHCPKGEAVAGIRGRSGQFVDALGLICKPISGGRSTWKENLLDFVAK